MRIEKIKYTDLNGKEHEETCYFHLNKLERTRFASKYPGGVSEWAKKNAMSGDAGGILKMIEEIVQMAYGVRSEDGSTFLKDPELTKKFAETEAYSELITSLLELDADENPTNLINFLHGVIGTNA